MEMDPVRKILIFANTYYQLILAIQMKFTLFKKDYICLALSDHSKNAESIYQKLNQNHFFEECIYIKSKGYIQNRGKKDKFIEFWQIIGEKSNRYIRYLDKLSSMYFDEVLFYNLEIDIYGIYSILSVYNEKVKFSSYEEGVLSYDNISYDSFKYKIIRGMRKLIGRPVITDYYNKFYCVYPELYSGKLDTCRIPPISTKNQELKKLLAYIFDLSKDVDYKKYKYIFFESIYETEGRGIGEMDFFLDFMKKVGKENILVKKHPRSEIQFFEENDIAVDKNSGAPFEAIQLNYDMSGCIFVAATSGSVLSVNSIVDKPSRVYMFYPMTEYRKIESLRIFVNHVGKIISEFKKKGKLEHVQIIHSLDELE